MGLHSGPKSVELVGASSPLKSAVRAEPLELEEDLNVEQGFRVIIRNCLQHIAANHAGVLRANDPEAIHQMRVGLRRMRSALRLFGSWDSLPQTLKQELRWLDEALGAARDADVLTIHTLPKLLAACPAKTGLQQLIQSESMVAKSIRELAGATVRSSQYSHLMTGLSEWLDATVWKESVGIGSRQACAISMRSRAARILAKRHESLLKRGKHLQDSTSEERHRTRIAARDLRYFAEFVQSLYSTRSTTRYIGRLMDVQASFGVLNDAAVADRLLLQIEHDKPDLAAAASFARGYICAAAITDRCSINKVWKRFRATMLF